MGWSEPAIFSDLGRHIFGTFTVEANVITRLIGFPDTLKCLTLNDLGMSFC